MEYNSIDIETLNHGGQLQAYCICIVYRGKRYHFYGLGKINDCLGWLFENCGSSSIFYAHNLTFDGCLILNSMSARYSVLSEGTLLKKCNIYALGIGYKNKKIFLKCSFRLVPLALKELAVLFNIGTKFEFDCKIVNIDNYLDLRLKSQVIRYCSNDAVLVVRFLEKLSRSLKKYTPITDVYTMSGLAERIYSRYYNEYKLKLRQPISFDTLFRSAYYGGRCEVFGNLKDGENCFHFDFSGMYSQQLLKEFPYGDYLYLNNCNSISAYGFYYVTVESNLDLPILPFRDLKSGKLLFPNGVFHGLYWGEELNLFLENGGIVKRIHYGIEFKCKAHVFKEFAETCIANRNISAHDRTIWKLIPNSFIGRLGMKYELEKTIIIKAEDYDPTSLNVIMDKQINDTFISRISLDEDIDSNSLGGNVLYPAIITARARIQWWRSARAVQLERGRILYCDTDSIFAAFRTEDDPIDKQHGDVFWDSKKIDTKLDDACFVTCKVYAIVYNNNTVVKMKGISRHVLRNWTMNDFKKNFHQKTKVNLNIDQFKKNNMFMTIDEINKQIDFSFYDKRIFNHNKTETTPLTINEETSDPI